MIPTIEVFTQNIKGKYQVTDKLAHQIIRLILDEEEKLQLVDTTWNNGGKDDK